MKHELTQAYCEAQDRSRPRKGERIITDTRIAGFTLRVSQRHCRFEMRVYSRVKGKDGKPVLKDGKRVRTTDCSPIGVLGKGDGFVTAAQARKEAKRRSGKPTGRMTLAEAWNDEFKPALAKRGRSQATIDSYQFSFNRIPKLHDKTLHQLSENPRLLKKDHDDITKEGKPYAANAVKRFVEALYNYIRKKDLVANLPAESPARAIDLNPEKARTAKLSRAELPAWEAARLKLKSPITRELVLFMLLTGLRRTDAMKCRWDEIIKERRVIHRPSPKGGEGRAFDLPLSKPIEDCLARLRERHGTYFEGSPWIFPSKKGGSGRVTDIKKLKLPKNGNGHNLRRSFSGLAQESGVPRALVKILLNHSTGDVTDEHYGPTVDLLTRMQEQASAYIVAGLNAAGANSEQIGREGVANSDQIR